MVIEATRFPSNAASGSCPPEARARTDPAVALSPAPVGSMGPSTQTPGTCVGSGSLTVNLYGTPVNRDVDIETSPLKASGPIPVKEVPDDTIYVGEQWVEDAGEPARTVSVRRIVYDANGEVLYDTTWSSSYLAEPKIVHVGTKPLPEPAPPETDEAPATTGAGTAATETQPTQ